MADIIALMKKHGVSQIPVLDGESLVGMINEVRLLKAMLDDRANIDRPVKELVEQSYAAVSRIHRCPDFPRFC